MPELLLTGEKSMVIAGGDPVYVERIRSILEMLQRQSHRVCFSEEGF
jgi:organic radical activating enzyme